ncbi:kinase-like domain-containing protein [Mycena capillaripes]|nr:kinase-like domain-containing protein [Mycena capillaripes]
MTARSLLTHGATIKAHSFESSSLHPFSLSTMSVAVGYADFTHEKSEALKEQLSFAKRVLKEALDVEIESLEPIARGYNNKVYLLKLLLRAPAARSRPLQAGCMPFPTQLPAFLIFRTVRIRSQTPAPRKVLNSVAAMQLVREHTDIPIAPTYAYDVDGEDAWMVEGVLPGIPMDEAWQPADKDTRVRMLEALTDVFAKLKTIPSPGGMFGGLGYDTEGKIVLGPTCLAYDEGPFVTAKDHYKAWIRGQWKDSKRNPVSDGWKIDGIDQRIEKFVAEGLDSALACLDESKPVFIHADFGMLNMLVSATAPETITGLLDFEWTHFGPESDEYFVRYH